MPVTRVGGDIVSRGASTASLTPDLNSISYQANDVAVLWAKNDDDNMNTTFPAGWTQKVFLSTTAGRDMRTYAYLRRLTASESNPTLTYSGTNQEATAAVEVYRGVDPNLSLDGFRVTTNTGSNDTTPNHVDIETEYDNSCVIIAHSASHDDITVASPPTGYTLGESVIGSTTDWRHLITAYDLDVGAAGNQVIGSWNHTSSPTNQSEWHVISIELPEVQPIVVTGGTATEEFNWGDNNLTITGFGFEAVQGTGKVEYWDDVTGTTKTVQTIDSWSDTSIQIDTVQGSLPNNTTIYLVVTNDSGDESAPLAVNVGILAYESLLKGFSPDHYWPMNNTYDDDGITGPARNFTGGIVGTWTFTTNEIRDGNTHAVNFDSVTQRRELSPNDSPNMNVTINAQERTLCMWIQTNIVQKPLAAWFKEGGGVQNLAFLMGFGNVILAQMADNPGSPGNIQAWSDIKLTPARPYHICMRYDFPDNFVLFLDGVEQTETSGNPLGVGNFDSHSGDVVLQDPDNNLETGGTDISYNGVEDGQMSDFATWSDNSAYSGRVGGAGGSLTDADIFTLFARGAVPDDTVGNTTEAAAQTAIDALATVRPDWPLSLRVEPMTDESNPTLTLDGWDFDDRISLDLEWRGGGTLTILARNGTNLDASQVYTPGGGSVTIIPDSVLTLTGLVANTEVRVYDAGTTTEIDGIENTVGTTFSTSISQDLTTSVDIQVVTIDFVIQRFTAVDLSGGDVTIPVTLQSDRTYSNP